MRFLKYFLMAALAFSFGAAIAQVDSTKAVAPSGILGFLGSLKSGSWAAIIAAIYEIIVRRVPTSKSLSIFSIIGKIIDFIIPNNIVPATGGAAPPGSTFPKAG